MKLGRDLPIKLQSDLSSLNPMNHSLACGTLQFDPKQRCLILQRGEWKDGAFKEDSTPRFFPVPDVTVEEAQIYAKEFEEPRPVYHLLESKHYLVASYRDETSTFKSLFLFFLNHPQSRHYLDLANSVFGSLNKLDRSHYV